MLGDYALIKSGSYKKLLTAYYKTESSDSTSSSSTSSSSDDTLETGRLVTVKTDANTLAEAADALGKSSLYTPTGRDDDGKAVYDKDEIKKSVNNFISAYNSYIDSTSNVDNQNVLSKSLSLVKKTAANQKLLTSVGIKIGEGNKLELDETKFDEAEVTTLSTLFKGSFSYGNEVSQKASETYKIANSAVYTGKSASSYTYSGAYSVLGTSNSYLDQYL
jgi:hypothetical protein